MSDSTRDAAIDQINLIDNPIQTRRAYLVWQSQLNEGGTRKRHAVGELWDDNGKEFFRYFDEDDLANAKRDGFNGYPGLPLCEDRKSHNLKKGVDVLFHRIIPSSRSDYEEYLNQFGIRKENNLSRISLLAYTGARLTRDSFSVCETFEEFDGRFSYLFDVAGYRDTWENGGRLKIDDPVKFVADPNHESDPHAVKIVDGGDGDRTFGYVNRLQSETVLGWLTKGEIDARVFHNFLHPNYFMMFVRADITSDRNAVAA